MNRYGQFSFFAAGACSVGAITSIIKGDIWLFFFNAFLCGINVWLGNFLIKLFDKK